jgi:two-component system sensor histidine kinase DevS
VTNVATLPDNALLLHAVERSPDGVLIVDESGVVVYANLAMAKIAGTTDLVGTAIDALVPSDVRERHASLRAEYHEQPTTRPMGSGLDLRLRRADGVEVPVEIALSPIELDGFYVVASVRDVTNRIEVQRRLAGAQGQLALVAERERIGRDLHDVVLQHLYGMGLGVQAIAATEPAVADRLDAIVDEVDDIISEVRTIVFTLGDSGAQGSLGQELADVVAQARRVLGFTPALRLDGPVESVLTPAIRSEMIASMREALGNVARHAEASWAGVRVAVEGDCVVLRVTDDGIGPPEEEDRLRGGHGLYNLQRRAEQLGGECTLTPGRRSGAVLAWSVPFATDEFH